MGRRFRYERRDCPCPLLGVIPSGVSQARLLRPGCFSGANAVEESLRLLRYPISRLFNPEFPHFLPPGFLPAGSFLSPDGPRVPHSPPENRTPPIPSAEPSPSIRSPSLYSR